MKILNDELENADAVEIDGDFVRWFNLYYPDLPSRNTASCDDVRLDAGENMCFTFDEINNATYDNGIYTVRVGSAEEEYEISLFNVRLL